MARMELPMQPMLPRLALFWTVFALVDLARGSGGIAGCNRRPRRNRDRDRQCGRIAGLRMQGRSGNRHARLAIPRTDRDAVHLRQDRRPPLCRTELGIDRRQRGERQGRWHALPRPAQSTFRCSSSKSLHGAATAGSPTSRRSSGSIPRAAWPKAHATKPAPFSACPTPPITPFSASPTLAGNPPRDKSRSSLKGGIMTQSTLAALATKPAPAPDLAAHQDPSAGARGRRATMPWSAPRFRSSAKICARRSTSVRDSKVLDVAAGNGNVALAAARRWCDVTATDYVPALLDRARERAAAERLKIEFREADAEALPFEDRSFDAVVSTFGVMFTPDQERSAQRARSRLQARRQDRPRQLDAGRLCRSALQDDRKARAAGARHEVAGALGHTRAHRRAVRAARTSIKSVAAELRVPLSLAGTLAGRVPDLLRAGAQDLRRARSGGAAGAAARSLDSVRQFNRSRDGTIVCRANISRSL